MADIQYDPIQRSRYAKMAKAWTRTQAVRLGYSPDEILAAVRKGWTAQDIEALPVAQADSLTLTPAEAVARKIRAAPILPVRLSRYESRQHERFVTNWNRAA